MISKFVRGTARRCKSGVPPFLRRRWNQSVLRVFRRFSVKAWNYTFDPCTGHCWRCSTVCTEVWSRVLAILRTPFQLGCKWDIQFQPTLPRAFPNHWYIQRSRDWHCDSQDASPHYGLHPRGNSMHCCWWPSKYKRASFARKRSGKRVWKLGLSKKRCAVFEALDSDRWFFMRLPCSPLSPPRFVLVSKLEYGLSQFPFRLPEARRWNPASAISQYGARIGPAMRYTFQHVCTGSDCNMSWVLEDAHK